MLGRRWESPSVVVWFAAAWAMILCLIWFGTSSAAEDPIVNCNEVDFEDRCACNMAVLRALAHIRPIVPDPVQSPNATPAHIQITVQEERLHRLRTFMAPDCERHSSPERLPLSSGSSAGLRAGANGDHLRPFGARRFDAPKWVDGELKKTDPKLLLEGRWEGWQTLADGKANPVFLHVIEVQRIGAEEPYYVRACSDQGMVLGRVKDGVLEFARSESPAFSYSIKLWKSGPPHYGDLEGVALLEIRPKQEVVAGLVWLSRAPKFPGIVPPSEYPCKNRALEDEKLIAELKALKKELEKLKKQIGSFNVD